MKTNNTLDIYMFLGESEDYGAPKKLMEVIYNCDVVPNVGETITTKISENTMIFRVVRRDFEIVKSYIKNSIGDPQDIRMITRLYCKIVGLEKTPV